MRVLIAEVRAMSSELGSWLRGQREARGWSRADVARRLAAAAREAGDDVTSSPENLRHSIYRWERGMAGISGPHRRLLCRAFGITPAEFARLAASSRAVDRPLEKAGAQLRPAARQMRDVGYQDEPTVAESDWRPTASEQLPRGADRMSDFGSEMGRWMGERGIGVRELHRRSGYSAAYITQLRQGQRSPSAHAAADLDDALGAGGALTALGPQAAGSAAGREKVRRALDAALADGMMTAALLDEWDAVTARYGDRTRDTPSPALLADLTVDLAELKVAISRHRSASALPRLTLAAARMSGLVCLTLVKAGDHQAWRGWARTSRHAAAEAADGPTFSWAAAQESYGYYYAGDFPGAVACARSALEAASAPCVGRALAAALEMRAHAAMGDAKAAMRALAEAERTHGLLAGEELASSAFGYAESQLRFHSGNALARLGDTSAARAVLDRALELCAPQDYTDWAMIRLDRAGCLILDGDLDAGLGYAAQTLLTLDIPKKQGIITGRGRELLAALTPAQQTSRDARELAELLGAPPSPKEMPA
jgi:transcriptional regulator with XRE-family HTH domain